MKRISFFFFCMGSFSLTAQASKDSLAVDALVQKAYTYFYTDEDSAYYYFDKINRFYTEKEEWEHVIVSLISVNRVASYHYNLQKMKSSLDTLGGIFKTHRTYLKALPDYGYYESSFLYDQGVYYFETDNYSQAQQAFRKIIATAEKLPDSLLTGETIDLLSGAYRFVAKMNSEEGRYDVAQQFYNKDIRFISAKKPDDQRSLFADYRLLAELFNRTKEIEKSTAYFKKALDYNLNHQGNQNTILTIAQALASNYVALNQPDSARYYLQVLKDNLTANHPFSNKYHDVKAAIYRAQHNDSLALHEYRTALALTKLKWQSRSHPEIAEYEHKIGLLFDATNNPTAALAHFETAINLLDGKGMLNVLKDKARVLSTAAVLEHDREVMETVEAAIAALDSLKPAFKSEADKLLLINDAFPLFESGMEAAYNRFRSTGDTEYIDRAFGYSEKSKNVLLFEALLSSKATRFGDVPEALLEQDKQLKAEISRIEKKMNTSGPVSDAQQDNLFALRERHRKLINTIETNYKSYYDLKYNTQVITAEALRKALDGNTVLLSYFFGTKALYCIGVSNRKTTFHRVPADQALSDRIIAYYRATNNPKADIGDLAKQSFELYSTLLENELREFPEKGRLVVVPDGLLNYVPFGQLNSSAQNLHYLIQDRAVSYVNSATLLMQLTEEKKVNQRFLGFAPSFNGMETGGLLPLPTNRKEVESILDYFDGQSLTGNRATLGNFISQSTDFGLLHIASHAVLDDSIPEFSYLAFQPESGQDHLLYVSDLYNLNLNSTLVTLSACETGIGNLKRGEGFMSLARGFYFSGASSIASSLWKINDASSATIMEHFYKHLAEGDEKDVALQKAKLDFLKANKDNALAHPYYWSGFVVSGNMAAVVENKGYVWYALIVGVLVMGGGLFLRRRRS